MKSLKRFLVLSFCLFVHLGKGNAEDLTLRIVEPEYNGPVEGVLVQVYIDDEEYEDYSDPNGEIVIELPEEGVQYGIRVTAKPERYLSTSVTWKRRELESLPGEITLTMAKGSTIGGTIQTETGKSIAHVKVIMSIFPVAGGEEQTFVTDHAERTDDRGQWRCHIAPKNIRSVRLRLVHPYYITNQYYDYGPGKDRMIGDLKTFDDRIVLKNSLSLEGMVFDEKGRGLKGARIATGGGRWERGRKPTAIADQAGRFQFKDLEPGERTLNVQAEGYAPTSQTVQVAEGMEPLRFLMKLAATIKGRIVDKEGIPIAKVNISSQGWEGEYNNRWRGVSDSEGRFECNSAPHGEVAFSFSKPDYQRLSKKLGPSEEEHEIVLGSPLIVSGSVEDAETGEPIEAFTVVQGIGWDNPNQQTHWQRHDPQKSADGEYRVAFTQSYPKHFVRIEAEGYLPGVSRAFTDEEGEQSFHFKLKKGVGPKGVVISPDGLPQLGVDVILCTPGNNATIQNGEWRQNSNALSTKTDENGSFSFTPQTESFSLLALSDLGYAETPEEELKLNNRIRLQPWGAITGILKIGSATGAEETVTVNLNRPYEQNRPQVHFYYQTTTDNFGRFRFDKVAPGEVTVSRQIIVQRHSGGGYSSSTNANSKRVTVKAGETLNVELGGKGRTVIGKVIFPATAEEKVAFGYGHYSLSTRPPTPISIEEIKSMTPEAAQKFYQSWQKTEEFKKYERSRRHYGFKLEPDGAFHVDDVESGTYTLNIQVQKPPAGGGYGRGESFGSVQKEVHIPQADEPQGGEPLDLGPLELNLHKADAMRPPGE